MCSNSRSPMFLESQGKALTGQSPLPCTSLLPGSPKLPQSVIQGALHLKTLALEGKRGGNACPSFATYLYGVSVAYKIHTLLLKFKNGCFNITQLDRGDPHHSSAPFGIEPTHQPGDAI